METLPALTAPLADWALWYAAQDWPVFPCHGKIPVTRHGFQDASTDPECIRSWWSQWPTCNIGASAGHAWWVLDEDPRNGGDAARVELEHSYGDLPTTMASLSGRKDGGCHRFWAMPAGGIHHKAAIGEGLDVIALGGYVILPPSIHPDTNLAYEWEYDPEELTPQPAPEWLLALVAADAEAPVHERGGLPLPGQPIPEGARETTLMRLAGSMRHYGATGEEIYAALSVANGRCVPPLPEDALSRMAHSTERYAPAPQLYVAASNGQTQTPPVGWGEHAPFAPPAAPERWRELLLTKKNGEPTQNAANFFLFLRHHPFWRQPENHLWWDVVRSKPMMGEMPIDDDTITTIAEWMGTVEKLPVSQLKLVERCVLKECRQDERDVLQLWLNMLPMWDGIARLDTWLLPVAGVDDTAYSRGISRVLPLSMVARAMDPGCLYRYVVILEGPEEAGKSTLVRALASPEWYVELSVGLDSKDAHMMLQGAWVAEMAELDSLSRTEETRLKAFITLRQDSYIPKYSNFRVAHHRRTIFIGTTNEESYLKGQTGNTRFLPIRVGHALDITAFQEMREQIFAEALAIWRMAPQTWWQLSPEALEQAVEERERRRLPNVYEQPLYEWLEYGRFAEPTYENGKVVVFLPEETSWPELASYYLKLRTPAEWKDQLLQKQIAQALRTLGWHREIIWRQGRTSKVWLRPQGE